MYDDFILMLDFFRNINPIEIGAIAIVLMLLFGRKVVVGIAKTAGQTFREIKKIAGGVSDTIEERNTSDDDKDE